jgi:hypothetical protein
MEKYYSKYLKYRQKYLQLKKQFGGENKLSLVSFNILNPFEKVASITFKNIFNLILNVHDGTLISKIHQLLPVDNSFLDFICEILALADQKRYVEQRLNNIINIIERNLEKSIIFLQEVDQFTLDKLKEKFNSVANISFNNEKDVLKFKRTDWKGNAKIDDYSRVEYRVIIIPKKLYNIVQTADLPLNLDDEKITIQKNGVFVEIENKINSKKYKLLNLHMHYTFTNEIITSFIPIIKSTINYDSSDNFLLGGDMNKKLSDLYNLTSTFEFNNNNQDESKHTFIETSNITSCPDHLLSKNISGKIEVITDFDGKQILYNVEMINMELINCLLENIDSIKEWKDWKEKKSTIEFEKLRADVLIDKLCRILSSSNNYISDHNPILFIED